MPGRWCAGERLPQVKITVQHPTLDASTSEHKILDTETRILNTSTEDWTMNDETYVMVAEH